MSWRGHAPYARWASQKSFRRKDGSDDDPPKGSDRNAGRNFHGERRCNETHESKTDPDALMFRKSQAHPAKLCYAGQVLMENRHGLVAEAEVVGASGSAERDTAIEMLSELPGTHPMTVGAHKAYDTRGFIEQARGLHITPHVAQNLARRGGSAILQPGTDAKPAPSGTPLGESGVGCRPSSHRRTPRRTRGHPPRPSALFLPTSHPIYCQ